MPYLAHSAHAQLGALPVGLMGWTLLAVCLGLVQWRVWLFSSSSSSSSISSGLVFIGIWRTCFYSHTQVTPGLLVMHCSVIHLNNPFTPPEIASAQILMFLSLIFGLVGYISGLYGLRNAYFGIKSLTRFAFHTGGALTLLSAILALIPLLWNLASVATGKTIDFLPDFGLPEFPDSQRVGGAIWVGLVGVALLLVTAVIFCSYKLPKERRHVRSREGKDNPVFESYEDRL